MQQIQVCLSPALIPLFDLEGKIVVVTDILRATSAIVAGIYNGAESIVPVKGLEETLEYKKQGFLVAGERNGQIVAGFDFGNSPYRFLEKDIKGSKIALSTTNGTQAIKASESADLVLVGAFLNLAITAEYISKSYKDVVVVCSGWKDNFNMEDTLYAGALVESLVESHKHIDDSSLAAKILYKEAKSDLYAFIQNSSHFHRLQKLGIEEDIKLCMQLDKFPSLPMLKNGALVNCYEGVY